MRSFEDKPAVRGHVPLIIGLTGPQSSGKTFSLLRLATGVQKVRGGEIFGIDTEAERMRHYADRFKFRHVDFKPPHGPLDYLAAINHCVERGAKIIVVDSMSHEHSGEGGILDRSEKFLDEKAGEDWKKRERMLMMSLIKPKSERKKLNRRIVQLADVTFLLAYRAEQKIKPRRGDEPEKLGWQPDSTSPLPYDMTVRFLLTPGSDGKPDFNPEEAAAKLAIKNPAQFRDWFKPGLQLSEDVGERLARWAAGDGGVPATPSPPPAGGVESRADVERQIWELLGKPPGSTWFVEKFGRKRATMSDDEIVEARNILELEQKGTP